MGRLKKQFRMEVKRTTGLFGTEGMALLITIVTLVLLVAATLQFHNKAWSGYRAAYAVQVNGKLQAMVSSGLNMAMIALIADLSENEYDSLFDRWARLTGDEVLASMFPEGELQVNVIDLAGRFPVNGLVQKEGQSGQAPTEESAQAGGPAEEKETGETGDVGADGTTSDQEALTEVFIRLLTSGNFAVEDEAQALAIVDAIKDWIDEDDEESEYGAESSYYQAADLPYTCRNSDITSVEELLLIRGITPELLFGNGEYKALADFIAIESDEWKINLNTAPKEILMSLDPLISEELANRLIEYREDEENKEALQNPGWYLSVGGWPGDIVISQKLLTANSMYFRVEAAGLRDTFRKKLTAVLERSDQNQLRLIWQRQE